MTNIFQNDDGYTIFNNAEKIMIFLLSLVIIVLLGIKNIVFFHTAIELIGAVIGACIFIIAINTYNLTKNTNYIFIGMTYGFIVLFEFLQSMYPPNSNYSLQLSLCGRIFQCLLALTLITKFMQTFNFKVIFYSYIFLTILFICSIFVWFTFPRCYIKNGSFSTFYSKTTLITLLIFVICLVSKLKSVKSANNPINYLVVMYCSLVVIYQSSIVVNIRDNNIHLMIIHIIKILTNYPLYLMITKLAFKEPISLFFEELNHKNEELIKKERLYLSYNQELANKNEALSKANETILNSQQKYERLIQFLPDAVVLLKGYSIVLANKNFYKIFSEFMPNSLENKDILELIPQKYKHQFTEIIDYVYKGNNIEAKEERFQLNSGKEIFVEYTVLYNNLNDEKYALILTEDITEKKLAREILQRTKIEEENERLKMGFLANISHELRTPINIIYSALQLEDNYLCNKDLASLERYNKVIKQNCFRLLRIINNLIDATKIDASFFKANMKHMNIVNLIEDVTLSVIPFIESKSMTLTFDTEVEEKYMLCDPDLIERVVLNLLSNSVKYGKYGGSISVSIVDNVDSILIYFKDDGIGIPKDKKSMLFNRFMQIDKSFSRNAEGSGIGLYLVKNFIEMHGGTVNLESEEGSGVEICITLPCTKQAEDIFPQVKELDINTNGNSNIIDRINIEFSDIYLD